MITAPEASAVKLEEVFSLVSVTQNENFKATDKLVLLTFDDNYVSLSINLMMSIVRHNENISFACICPGLRQENLDILMKLPYGIQVKCYEFRAPLDTGKWPVCAVFRLFCPWLLDQDFHKILYMDADILCSGSLKELFELEVGCIAMCNEICGNVNQFQQDTVRPYCPTQIYCNSGVVLFNLDYLRENYTFQTLFDALRKMEGSVGYLDQDFLNVYFKGKIEYMNGFHYNFQPYELRKTEFYEKALNNCRLIHFSVGKPWERTTNLQLIRLYLQHSEYPEMIQRCQKAARQRVWYLPVAAVRKVWFAVMSRLKRE